MSDDTTLSPLPGGTAPIYRIGLFCETPSGNVIEMPTLGPRFDKLIGDYCHKASQNYLSKARLEMLFPLPTSLVGGKLLTIDIDKFPTFDGTMVRTPSLSLGKFDFAAIFSAKLALPLGNSEITGAGAAIGYHVSPTFHLGLTGSYGESSQTMFGQPAPTQSVLGVTFVLKKEF